MILFLGLNIIASFFSSYGDVEDIPPDLRYQFTNIIKMTLYIFVEFVLSFNSKIETDYKLIVLESKVFLFFYLVLFIVQYTFV